MSTSFSEETIYRDKVFAALLSTPEFDIAAKVKPENRDKFRAAIKEIKDRQIDFFNNVTVDYNHNGTKIITKSL